MMLISRAASRTCHLAPVCSISFSTETTTKSWIIFQRSPHDIVGGGQAEALKIDPMNGSVQIVPPSSTQQQQSSSPYWRSFIFQTFLPQGYPSTVAPGYLNYVGWQALHHTAGAANGVLASTFLLYSVGLGAGAIPTAGALSWVLKDGLGQLGTLLFGRLMAHNFDVSSRQWYCLASLKLNVAMGLEITTALAPLYFLPLGAAANAVKGLAWMAGGSSRSAFNVAFARDRNIADITSKATSQTIFTSLIGTGVGMSIAAAIQQSIGLAFFWYAVLGAVHMYSSVQSAQSVPLNTLNPSRLDVLVRRVIMSNNNKSSSSSGGGGGGVKTKLPTPSQLAAEDAVFPNLRWRSSTTNRCVDVVVGSSLQRLTAEQPQLVAALLPMYRQRKYILLPGRVTVTSSSSSSRFHLILHESARTEDAVCALLQAHLWAQENKKEISNSSASSAASTIAIINDEKEDERMAHDALEAAKKMAPGMVQDLAAAGWDVQGVVLEPRRGRRATW